MKIVMWFQATITPLRTVEQSCSLSYSQHRGHCSWRWWGMYHKWTSLHIAYRIPFPTDFSTYTLFFAHTLTLASHDVPTMLITSLLLAFSALLAAAPGLFDPTQVARQESTSAGAYMCASTPISTASRQAAAGTLPAGIATVSRNHMRNSGPLGLILVVIARCTNRIIALVHRFK